MPEIADYIKNYKNDSGFTALMIAQRMADTTIVEKLLVAGADSNITNFWGKTPLDYAREHSRVAVIKLLEAHMKKAIS